MKQSVLALTVFIALADSAPAQSVGTILSHRVLDRNTEGLDIRLFNNFGRSSAPLGDLDGDGVADLAVGGSSEIGSSIGVVRVLFLNPEGGVKSIQVIGLGLGILPGLPTNRTSFGFAMAPMGDLNGDGVTDLAVSAPTDSVGGGIDPGGVVWILFLNPDGTVKAFQRITADEGGFIGELDETNSFGISLASLNDFDGDGVTDLAVGDTGDDDAGSNFGAVWILYLNPDGTVKSHRKLLPPAGSFTGSKGTDANFGGSVGNLGDVDGDGVIDLGIEDSSLADSEARGFVNGFWVAFMNADGSVRAYQEITTEVGVLAGQFINANSRNFGDSPVGLGDLDGDGIPDVAVGESGNSGGFDGALWILFLNADGTVKAHQELSPSEGNLPFELSFQSRFAQNLSNLGDLDGDGRMELGASVNQLAGAPLNDGALIILTLRGEADAAVDTPLLDLDFKPADSVAGWLGGPSGAFGGSAAHDPARGLCLTVDGPGDNFALWVSPRGLVPLMDSVVYRARLTLNTDQTAPDAIPLFNFTYENFSPTFSNYGGERWIWDATSHGGAQRMGSVAAETVFEFWFAPVSLALPQWRDSNDAGSTAFDPEADALNDMQLKFRVIDIAGGPDPLGAATDSGTICVERLQISTVPLTRLNAGATAIYNPPLDDGSDVPGAENPEAAGRTHFPNTDANRASFPTISADIVGGEWQVTMPPIDAASDPAGIGFLRATLGPDVVAAGPRRIDGIPNPLRLFPIAWEADALYMTSAMIRSAVPGDFEGANPVDLIILNHQTFTAELGGFDYVTSGVDLNGAAPGDGGGMLRAGSPRLAVTTGGRVPEYHAFFHGNRATASLAENAAQWKAQIDLFNRADLAGGPASGTDPLAVEALRVDRIDGLILIY